MSELDDVMMYENLRYLFNYRNNYTDNLCITETYLAENNYNEALATLANIYTQFEVSEEQVNELTGLQTYTHWLQQLEEQEKSIYTLSEADIMQLINFVETHTGRGIGFAKNILCAIYNICMEEDGALQMPLNDGSQKPEVRSKKSEVSDDEVMNNLWKSAESVENNAFENITLTPNPTTGELTINNEQLIINNVEIFDVYGRNVSSHHLITSSSNHHISISHLQAGIYFVKISTEAGEVVKKIVKQ
jgi:hypothetical protein